MILSSDTPSCVLSPAVLQKEWLQNKQWRLPWQFQRWRQLAVPYDISSSDHEERIVLHHQVCRELLYTCTIRYSQTINYLKSRIIRYLKFIPSDITSSQCQILNICTTKHLMLLPSDTPSCVPSAATQQKKWLQCNQWRLSLWIWSYPKLCTIRGSTTEWMTTLQSMKITITNLKMKTIGHTIRYLKLEPQNMHSSHHVPSNISNWYRQILHVPYCWILYIHKTKHLMSLQSDTPSCVPSAVIQQKELLQYYEWRLSWQFWWWRQLAVPS